METLSTQYYLKALESFPWNLADVFENLNYALGYNEDHAPAHCLYGRLCMSYLKDLKEAEYHFEQALRIDFDFPDTYKYYSQLKMWKGEFKSAKRIIDFGMNRAGVDKSILLFRKAQICEIQSNYDRAEWYLYQAIRWSQCTENREKLISERKRIKQWRRRIKKAKRKYLEKI